MVGIFTCTVMLTFTMDVHCHNDIEHWMPVYPGSVEIVEETRHDFFRPRAMGRTLMYFTTDDMPNVVRKWYRDHRREITRGRYSPNSETAMQGVSNTLYQVQENADGDGSIITHRSECAFN